MLQAYRRFLFNHKINNMSKTFETNAQKALTMAAGIKKHLDQVAHLGVKEDVLDKITADAELAIEMSREVDSLRQLTSEKLQQVNDKLAEVKEAAMHYRTLIKCNYPPERWEEFGIMDKR